MRGINNGHSAEGDRSFQGSTRSFLETGDGCRGRTLDNPWELLVLPWKFLRKQLAPKMYTISLMRWDIPRKLSQLPWERPRAFVEWGKTSVKAVEASAKAAEVSMEAFASVH